MGANKTTHPGREGKCPNSQYWTPMAAGSKPSASISKARHTSHGDAGPRRFGSMGSEDGRGTSIDVRGHTRGGARGDKTHGSGGGEQLNVGSFFLIVGAAEEKIPELVLFQLPTTTDTLGQGVRLAPVGRPFCV